MQQPHAEYADVKNILWTIMHHHNRVRSWQYAQAHIQRTTSVAQYTNIV